MSPETRNSFFTLNILSGAKEPIDICLWSAFGINYVNLFSILLETAHFVTDRDHLNVLSKKLGQHEVPKAPDPH